MTRAEAIGLALVSVLATGVILPYLTDALGFGVAPNATAIVAIAMAGALIAWIRPAASGLADTAVFLSVVGASLFVLGRLAWPALLPPGAGPDLTHHLLLVDYIERHGTLVHDPNAAAAIGEMAHYTPGVHLLAVIAGAMTRTNGFLAIYPVVAFSVALKFGLFALCQRRLLTAVPARVFLAIGRCRPHFYASAYTLGSFIHDSFLAQAVAELFALTMWWALIVWDQQPSAWAMAVFGACGVAAFLTWPVWVGPPVAALAILLLVRHGLPVDQRIRHFLVAATPIAAFAALHALGRSGVLSLVGTSGAVSLPPVAQLGWWLPLLAVVGLVMSARTPRQRGLLAFAAGLALRAMALWLLSRLSGASTPYMAVKMLYLAIYPAIASATMAIGRVSPKPLWTVLAVGVMLAASGRHAAEITAPTPTVSRDLWAAGSWARDHLPASCVDYLVGNEYTAYWLHLAVLGNPRAAARSTDNDTYATQPSFMRWLTAEGGVPYSISRMSVLPAEIRDRVRVVYQVDDAVVIERPGACP